MTNSALQETTRPRPTRYDRELRRAAAEAIVPEIAEWSGEEIDGAERDRLVKLLTSECGKNGYEIAREMEREGYSPDAHLVEILDGLDTHEAYSDAVIAWIAETGATPKFAIGATVTLPTRNRPAKYEGITGEIVRIDERRGEYTVYCAALGHVREGLGTYGSIFPWEEVEACNAEVPSNV